jgi:hypothetical protein
MDISMAGRSLTSRKKRRYLIEWQENDSLCTGFTQDVSPTGLFVRSSYIPRVGSALVITLLSPGGGKLRLRGTVVRTQRVPQNLRGVLPSGFGVRLKEAPEEYFQLLASVFGLRLADAG